jgi:SAM-dependent methyltransferase
MTEKPAPRRRKAPAKQPVVVLEAQPEQSFVPYDENLLERARTQWQFGDWQSLAQINRDTLQHHPDRAKLALLAAAGRLQTGNEAEARQFIRLAQDWGCSKKLVSQILVAGVHNSIGRAAAIGNQQHRALQHFENAITIGTPDCDAKLLTQARSGHQLSQLGLATRGDFGKVGVGRAVSTNGCQSLSPEILEKPDNEKYADFSSGKYWEERYQKGGTSGYGSYGRLAEFKAKVINKFIEDEGIERVIEFGCGDGNQLSMLRVKSYVGVDISPTVVDKCKDRFKNDVSKLLLTNDEYLANPLKGDLTLSLDVIFHLVENDVFERYMNMLFSASTKYLIVYASDSIAMNDPAIHVRHRKFTDWIKSNLHDWRLMQVTYNKYPHDGSVNPKDYSFSDFYFYERN